MQRKLIVFVMLIVLVSVLSGLQCTAQTMEVDIYSIDDNPKFRLSLSSDNPYYIATQPFEYDTDAREDVIISLLDSAGNVLVSKNAGEHEAFFYRPELAQIIIEKAGEVVVSQDVSFCNLNGICEPCSSDNCGLAENSDTCADCPSGTLDWYCDLKRDGICDPDCDGYDGDCPGCTGCYFDDSTCESIGGQFCSPEQDCINGYFDEGFRQGYDMPTCCVGGTCGDYAEYAETRRAVEYYPEYVEFPQEIPSGTCEGRGGRLCSYDQLCDGKWDFYIPSDSLDYDLCCIGSCYTDPEELVGTPQYEQLRRASEQPLSDEDIALAMANEPSVFNDPYVEEVNVTFQDIEDYTSAGWAYTESGDVISSPDTDLTPEDLVNYNEEKTGYMTLEEAEAQERVEAEAYDLTSYLTEQRIPQSVIMIIGAGILLLVFSLVLIFKLKAKKTVPAAPDAYDKIDKLRKQGVDYKEIQRQLVADGMSPQDAYKAVYDYYNSREVKR